jgi:tRNA pseudouridine38-40 synthase
MAGQGKMTPADVRAALEARSRSACGPVAPPDGLYFMQVDYPDDAGSPRVDVEKPLQGIREEE